MEYNPLSDKHTELITCQGVEILTGQSHVPREVPLAFQIEGLGSTYYVEDVVQHWPGDHITQDELDLRLRSLRSGIDRNLVPLGIGRSLYSVLDQTG